MKFKQILHPEFVMGLRSARASNFVEILKKFNYDSSGVLKGVDRDLQYINGPITYHALELWAICQRYRLFGKNLVYHVNKDFLLELSKVKGTVPTDLIPDDFFGYISFADKTIFGEGHSIQGAYLFIGDGKYTSKPHYLAGRKCLWAVYLSEFSGPTGKLRCHTNWLLLPLDFENKKSIMDVVCEDLNEQGKNLSFTKEERAEQETIFRTLINTVIYVHSKEPNITRVRSLKDLTHKQRVLEKNTQSIHNESPFNIKFINWNFACPPPIYFGEEKILRRGHFHWYQCGPRKSEWILKWLDPTEVRKRIGEGEFLKQSAQLEGPHEVV